MAEFKKIQDRVAAVLAPDVGEEKARQIGFHMADWSDDLEQLHEAWRNLDDIGDERLSKIVYAFLAHVPDHVAAAKKLIGYGPTEDVFDVGVLEEGEGE